jgi:hypothetical protein
MKVLLLWAVMYHMLVYVYNNQHMLCNNPEEQRLEEKLFGHPLLHEIRNPCCINGLHILGLMLISDG